MLIITNERNGLKSLRTSLGYRTREEGNEFLDDLLSIDALLVGAVVVDGIGNSLEPDCRADHPVCERCD